MIPMGDPVASEPEATDSGLATAGRSHDSLWKQALGRVRFPALSAAGPSGSRPEHLKECVVARKRSTAQRQLKAPAPLSRTGSAGNLPRSAACITDSRVAFLSKPGTETPRPIRVGELWRRIIAKHAVVDSSSHLQKLFLLHGQCGIAALGGADLLVHLRQCIEKAGANSPEALVVLDLDLRNAFLSLERNSIAASVAELPQH